MKTLSTHAHAAKLIRIDLKAAFKGVKFAVKSRRYSGGSSVDIDWTNGPTGDQVNAVVGGYQEGHFDGMTDSYEYSNTNKNIPQVRFVQLQRNITDTAIKAVFSLYISKFSDFHGKEIDESVALNGRFTTVRQECRRILSNIDLTKPLTSDAIWASR